MKFDSPVQIWTDKENPRLLFQSKELQFEYQHGSSCYWLGLDFRYSYDEDTKEKISKDNEKLFELNLLKWHDIKEIDRTCTLATQNNR